MENQNEAIVAMELGTNILGKIFPNIPVSSQGVLPGVNFAESTEQRKPIPKERNRTKSMPMKRNNNKVPENLRDDINVGRNREEWGSRPLPRDFHHHNGVRGGRFYRGRGHGQKLVRPQNPPPEAPTLENGRKVEMANENRSGQDNNAPINTDKDEPKKSNNDVVEAPSKAPYNLRNAKKPVAEPLPRTPIKTHDCEVNNDDDLFKKPGSINNLTIVQLLRDEVDTCSSPVAGGNLVSKVKHIEDDLPRSPPSSTSTMSAAECQSKLKDFSNSSGSTIKEGSECVNKSILKSSVSGDAILAQYELLSSGKTSSMKPMIVDISEYDPVDPGFMPISLALGKDYLFASSQSTNQVHVFKNGKPQGVLKINKTKYFKSVHNVHTIMDKSVSHHVMVLDNEGCHCYVENGLYIETLLEKDGYRYRGLSHTMIQDKVCMVTLDIRADDGVDIIFVDITSSSKNARSIIQRIKIPETAGLGDDRTKCRFVMDYHYNEMHRIFVTAVKLNKIFVLDPKTQTFRSHPFDEPTGIAYEPTNGNIFVSSRSKKTIQVFNWKMEPLGTFLKSTEKFQCSPIGLCIQDDNVLVANNESGNILQVKFKL